MPTTNASAPVARAAQRTCRARVGVGQTADVDAVVDHAHLRCGEALADQVLPQFSETANTRARRRAEERGWPAGASATAARRQPPVLGEHDRRIAAATARASAAVDERRVVMAVKHGRVMRRAAAATARPSDGCEARVAAERGDRMPARLELVGPRACLVETAHRHRHIAPQAPHQLHHQPLGSAGIEAEDDLQHAQGTNGLRLGADDAAGVLCHVGGQLDSVASVLLASAVSPGGSFSASARCSDSRAFTLSPLPAYARPRR